MTTSTYSPTFLAPQQQFGQFGWGGPQQGIDQIVPGIQLAVQLLVNAQQHLWTVQQIISQLPQQLTGMQQPYGHYGQQHLPYQQFGQQYGQQFGQQQRPYGMGW